MTLIGSILIAFLLWKGLVLGLGLATAEMPFGTSEEEWETHRAGFWILAVVLVIAAFLIF